MNRIILEVPDETLAALRLTPEAFGDELRMAAAVKLCEPGRLSPGAPAMLAGVQRVVFPARLTGYATPSA